MDETPTFIQNFSPGILLEAPGAHAHAVLGPSERPFPKSAGAIKSRLSRIFVGNPMVNPKRKSRRRSSKSGTGKKFPLSCEMNFFSFEKRRQSELTQEQGKRILAHGVFGKEPRERERS
ncbi:hypothetical protein AVEN_13337-1 [Araneus ventricosus]|uniref:Uncharacterized protein n=1 Tax=Araneus ventricosus TaxID=182803 RepID=A0A4Y2ALX7_ARAVE|nr:hypothetical protein AVEN_239955-1 [Araneus ventricosus]GBL80246.1 hypothetical protein AVEN_13337-1 [Araneus ventricosus]